MVRSQTVVSPLQRQNLTVQPRDAVIINTGCGGLWGKDHARYARNDHGIGVAAAEWLARQDPMLIVNGIHLLENLMLEELVAKRVYEFALMLQPLKIQGGTGSTVAVR